MTRDLEALCLDFVAVGHQPVYRADHALSLIFREVRGFFVVGEC